MRQAGLRGYNERDTANLLETDAKVTVIPADRSWFERGVDLYRRRPDKEWSLTDCISFVVMEEEEIREALTADAHFEQAGFVALLRPPP